MPVTKKFLKTKPEVQVTFEVTKEAAKEAQQELARMDQG